MEALTAMGFPDHMCAKAMRMTGGDVEAAANYIMGMLPTQHTRARARAQVAAGSGVCGLRHLLPRLAQHPRPLLPRYSSSHCLSAARGCGEVWQVTWTSPSSGGLGRLARRRASY